MNCTLAVLSALMLILSASAQGMDQKACPLDVRQATENVRPDESSRDSEEEHRDDKATGADTENSAVSPADGKTDLDNFTSGIPVIDGGIVKGPVLDQKNADICWAEAKSEFVGSLVLRDTGVFVQTSPDHDGFWHVYDQIFEHPEYFQELAGKVQRGEYTMEQAAAETIRMFRSRPTSRDRRKAGFLTAKSRAKIAKQPDYVIEPGSDEPTALTEALKYGMVLNSAFTMPIATATDSNNLTNAFKTIVQEILKNPNRASLFTQPDPDSPTGVNDGLYSLLTGELAPFLKDGNGTSRLPLRPKDTFTWTDVNGNPVTGTPLAFMSNRLNFDPTQYAMVVATADNIDLLYEAIDESLKGIGVKPTPVMLGFAVYNQAQAEDLRVWTTDLFTNGAAPSLAGGHETVISNELTGAPQSLENKTANLARSTVQTLTNFVGWIFRNSWGLQGFDANGKDSATPDQLGYNGTTPGYDKWTIQQGEGPDYVLAKAQLAQAKFASLHASISTDLPSLTNSTGPSVKIRTGRRSNR